MLYIWDRGFFVIDENFLLIFSKVSFLNANTRNIKNTNPTKNSKHHTQNHKFHIRSLIHKFPLSISEVNIIVFTRNPLNPYEVAKFHKTPPITFLYSRVEGL